MQLKEVRQEFLSELKGHPKTKKLTFLEGVAMLVGTNIGIGILSIAYTSKNAGFFPLLFWLVLAGILSTITMLYIAETSMRTKQHLQLTGLCSKYMGTSAKWLMFLSTAVTSIGALVAYEQASGRILNELFSISNSLGSIVFFFPAAFVLWLGLKAIGRGEKQIVGVMFGILCVLIIATLFKESTNFSHLFEFGEHYVIASIPIFNVVVFVYSSQYIVPEMAKGFSHKPDLLPKAIVIGNIITFCMLALIPLSAISIEGLQNISDVVTLSWGKAIGQWAYYLANLFALCAILTSYWGLGGMFVTNIANYINVNADKNLIVRFFILLLVVIPPLVLVLCNAVESVDQALYWPGVVGALILSFFPIILLHNSRKMNEKKTKYICSKFLTNRFVKFLIIIVYLSATLGSVLSHYGILNELIFSFMIF
ncbi:amino acid permease [Campylobacter sp. MIT 21-1685]|uniref:aromatic amino acid transport family protein n=1 Tax=unclassified Campylobacter TaxID=2593542 RepID=UPI00224B13BB|nr:MULTISPECIES: aromatic amino acid transport family protein [unclassified Campylobacter]MCX2682260.1 amino acid permease [Campylobacter sp. MIT 21-1684]MCX2750541.1 amino acid permease [Campylobacter sp. MIT 21-1682]MCX2806911.1 amino acid permease [Campylobacter sp. MIT 21-1685]